MTSEARDAADSTEGASVLRYLLDHSGEAFLHKIAAHLGWSSDDTAALLDQLAVDGYARTMPKKAPGPTRWKLTTKGTTRARTVPPGL